MSGAATCAVGYALPTQLLRGVRRVGRAQRGLSDRQSELEDDRDRVRDILGRVHTVHEELHA
eukprot:COSAG02_NODE_28672_length_585_cov_0.650206_1_plen_62_part_00